MAEKTSDFRNLTSDELNIKLTGLKTDLYNLRYQEKAGRIEKPHRIRQIKRDIARINTVLREEGLKKDATGAKKT